MELSEKIRQLSDDELKRRRDAIEVRPGNKSRVQDGQARSGRNAWKQTLHSINLAELDDEPEGAA